MNTIRWKHVGILLILCTLPMTTGCGTVMNLTGVSTLANKEVRTASVMGGIQTDAYFMKHGRSTDPCDPLGWVFDMYLSLAADVFVLPLTLSIAAIVGDGPFAPNSDPKSSPKDEPVESPARPTGKGGR